MDLIILSARIFTSDPARPQAQALAVENGRIAALGTDDTIKPLAGPKTRILELPGRLVTPGLTDAHTHFTMFGQSLRTVDLKNTPSWEACLERVGKAARNRPAGEWILGWGWNHHSWEDQTEPTKEGLDKVAPDNPVMMVRACGHIVAVNSRALALAGIDRDTPDPAGGRIERDPSGEPNGLLRNVRKLIEEVIPKPTLEDLKRDALAAQEAALKTGLTGVHSIELLPQWDAMAALEQEGKLKMRIHHLLRPEDLEEAAGRNMKPGFGSDKLWFGMIKLFADGSLGAGTALLHQPYQDNPDNRGFAYTEPEDLLAYVEQAYAYGCDLAIHAIGDRGATNALDALAKGREKHPGQWRDRIEHVQLCRAEDRQRFKEMDVTASIQPIFVPTDWATAEAKWGPDRCLDAYAWKTLVDLGIRVQFGSDAPVEPIAPILGLKAAVTRSCGHDSQESWRADQCLTLEQSIAGFTQTAAWTSRKEDRLGSIAPGKYADLTVFEKDLFEIPAKEWAGVGVEKTIIEGQVEYGD